MYKIVVSETNVKTNGMGVQNGPLTKNGVLPSNYFVFLKILFQLKDLL